MRRLSRLSAAQDAPLVGLTWALADHGTQALPDAATAWQPLAEPLVNLTPEAQAAGALADERHWWLRAEFAVPDLAQAAQWRLRIGGLATVAKVWLNGELLLESQNMFLAHELVLDAGQLRRQGNVLLVDIAPLSQAWAGRKGRPLWRTPMVTQQALRWARTTLLGRTPGWSLPTPVLGVWQALHLTAVRAEDLTHLRYEARIEADQGLLQAELGFGDQADASLPETLQGAQLGLRRAGQVALWTAALQPMGSGRWGAEVQVPQVERWWPHTHGEPALYEVGLVDAQGQWQRRLGEVGFRTLRFEDQGQGPCLWVNDQPIFARGACWTPPDAQRLRVPDDDYLALMQPLREAGLNLLRVPGPMAYEGEAFWNACDRLGILVWQDLMFANMDYPQRDAAFLAEVGEELAQQAVGWQGRPSLAVVCGNSEVAQQAAMWGAPREHWSSDLFESVLPERLRHWLPRAAYWPSSAWGGAFPFQPDQGTCSYYGVGAYRRGLEDAQHSGLRFATEALAFANIPDDNTLAEMRGDNHGQPVRRHSAVWKRGAPRDLGAGWDFDDVRDHYVERLYGVRPDVLRAHDPQRDLMLGRAAVADVMASSFQRWRQVASRCRGALVWTLRDLQAGAGWGVLDHAGRPKSAFHALASVWQPLHLGLTDEGLNGPQVHLINESAHPRQGRLDLQVWREGAQPLTQAQVELSLPARGQHQVAALSLFDSFWDLGWSYRFGPPVAQALVARWQDEQGADVQRVLYLPQDGPLIQRELGLQAQAECQEDGRRKVRIQANSLARGVHLEVEGWMADRSFFDVVPDRSEWVWLRPVDPAAPKPLRAQVQAINGLSPVSVTGGL